MFNVDIYYFQVRMSRFYSRREKPVVDTSYQEKLDRYKRNFNLYVIINWMYCGGNMNKHLLYYRIRFPNTQVPSEEEQDFCICGRFLREERYYLKKTVHYIDGKLSDNYNQKI